MPSRSNDPAKKEGRGRALWRALHDFFEKPLNGLLAGVVVAAVLSLSFVVAEELNVRASSTEFCISCHSMGAYVYEEFKQSKHYNTASGVRPQCGDCHVSKRFWPAVWDHIMGTEDLIGEYSHDWSRPEVFEEKRPAMAEKVRMQMLNNDSKNCRECHVWEAVQPKRKRGQRAHKAAIEEGKTCIACHYNLVHKKVPLSDTFKQAVDQYGKPGKGLSSGVAQTGDS
ncbi:NapC/NirT family cytochrome c [Sedimenticola hydrogenitrophicus]|uniref:NapC/NirT family cytochrome c n=1 Tax=Sedimenticola hydrogenitrophicus TaxID=2967975 RepID=UPI0023AEB61A|nr:NapC/NirT family cytochrome c [Sedimenticola hydrogenitrophicus]